MNRIFGAPKAKAKPAAPYTGPTLGETSQKMDARVTDIDRKIKGCDEDIQAYMKNRSGTSGALAKSKALQAMKRKKM